MEWTPQELTPMWIFHFSVQDQKLWKGPPRIWYLVEMFLNSFLISGSKVVEWTPKDLTSGGNLWNSTFAYTVQWCMLICHKPFSHQLRAILKCSFTIFLLKMQMSNGCNALNIARNPITVISVNLSFLSSGSKLWNGPPSSDIWCYTAVYCGHDYHGMSFLFAEFAVASILGVI